MLVVSRVAALAWVIAIGSVLCSTRANGDVRAGAAGLTPEVPLSANAGRLIVVQPRPVDSTLEVDPGTTVHRAAPGEHRHQFSVALRNPSSLPVVVNAIHTSCGCTVVHLPAQPWVIEPRKTEILPVAVDFAGKRGQFTKTATLETSRGIREIALTVEVPPPADEAERRALGIQLATLDRQAVFKGDCARCHVAPAVGLHGAKLYSAACGICHDAEARASMVPDLRALPAPLSSELWRTLIEHGRPGTLMPAFAESEGGPLSPAQVDSLVEYMRAAFPPKVHAPGNAGPVVDR